MCQLANNHGMLALGEDLEQAMRHAVELETLARQHMISTLVGEPVLLSTDVIREAAAAIDGYGLKRPKVRSSAGAGSRRGPAAKRGA